MFLFESKIQSKEDLVEFAYCNSCRTFYWRKFI